MVQFAAGIAEIDFAEANNALPILRNGDERAFPREGIRKELQGFLIGAAGIFPPEMGGNSVIRYRCPAAYSMGFSLFFFLRKFAAAQMPQPMPHISSISPVKMPKRA